MIATVIALAGCSLTPNVDEREAATSVPVEFAQADTSGAVDYLRWWSTFGDEKLDTVVEMALQNNLDLRAAVARVDEIQSRYRITRSARYPTVNGQLEGSRQNTPTNTGPTGEIGSGIPGFPDRFDVTSYQASLGFSFELDFWGRNKSASAAAMNQYLATEADLITVQTAVISETVATYTEIAELWRLIDLARENIDLLEERVELTEDRYRYGLLGSFELYTFRQTFQQIRAAVPLLEAQLFGATQRLALLTGRFSLDADVRAADLLGLDQVIEGVPAGLPSELLRNRPDVVAAELRMEAARQQIGVARADRFPRFSLTAAGGTQTSDLTTLLNTSQAFWMFGGAIAFPIFNAGALKANVNASWAQYEQAALAYEKTVLVAFQEVETALVAHAKERERYFVVLEEFEHAQASARTQSDRRLRGIGDHLDYLDAQRNLVRVQQSLASAHAALVRARLTVHRSLGGAWVELDENEGQVAVNERGVEQ